MEILLQVRQSLAGRLTGIARQAGSQRLVPLPGNAGTAGGHRGTPPDPHWRGQRRIRHNMDKEHIMSTHGAPASAVDDTTGRLPGRQRGRLARRPLPSAAAIALVAGTGAMAGLAAASPASAATAGTNGQLTLDPSCDEGSCSQVFTSSGTFTTADIGQAGNITFILIGGAGGSAGRPPGGSGGYVTTTYTVPPSWEGFATFQVSVGGDGGNANGSAGGAGGADGGGAGGNGIGGEGGGGGGGATAVYAADSLVVAPGAGNLVGVAPGGGGAADGFAGGSFNNYTPAGYGPQVSSGGNISYGYGPAYCGGGAGGGTAGGAGGGRCTSWGRRRWRPVLRGLRMPAGQCRDARRRRRRRRPVRRRRRRRPSH